MRARLLPLLAVVLAGCAGHTAGQAQKPARPRPAAAAATAHPVAVTRPTCGNRQGHEHLITRRTWLSGVAITEYYSTPERLFAGRRVHAPGLAGMHRADWLYSSQGVAMEGDGIGADGRHYHIDALGTGGWVNGAGRRTQAGRCAGQWSRGRPAWLEGGWRNRTGQVTFPLAAGGWSNGPGVRRVSYRGVTFAPGSSITLAPYRTLAVDPGLIPMGSRVYIPAYRSHGGWFRAQDVGGAIQGRHVDVYRPPPATLADKGRYLRQQRILVVPPGS